MAVIRIIKNIFLKESQEREVKSGKTVEECLCDFDEPVFNKGSVEVYDCDTGETTYVEITDDNEYLNAVIIVNGEDKGLDYVIKDNDIISVTFYPGNGDTGTIWKNIGLAVTGAAFIAGGIAISVLSAGSLTGIGLELAKYGGMFIGIAGAGLMATSVMGFVSGDFLPSTVWDSLTKKLNDGSNSSGKSLKQIPNVRNARNETIIGNTIPFVMGMQQISPFIVGSPFYDISGDRGTIQYITLLYCIGYAPLKLTDFKLNNIYLARNRNVASGNHDTVMHGMLRGYSDTTGDIEDKWKYNDVSLEILQKGDDYGTLYNKKIIAEPIKSYVLHIYDKDLSNIQYGGVELASGYRTNTVKFTQSCPYEISVELNLESGFYRTRSESSDGNSKVVYNTMPCWVAIQYRLYKDDTETYNSAEYYKGDATHDGGWKDFTSINNGFISLSDYNSSARSDENTYHAGDSLDENYNNGWINGKAFNLSPLEDGTGSGVTQIRLIASHTFTVTECAEIAGIIKDLEGNKYADLTTLQVRVIRLSPQYCAQSSSNDSKHGTWSYVEDIKWKYLTSKCFDRDKLSDYYKTNGSLPSSIDDYVLKPCNSTNLNNACYVALKVKADSAGEISNDLDKLSVTVESLAPKYDDTDKTWYPEIVTNTKKYYGAPVYNSTLGKYEMGAEITKEQYITDRQSGIKAIEYDSGTDMVTQIKSELFNPSDSSVYDSTNSRYILSDALNTKYVTNNPASMFLLATCGILLKRESLEYYAQNKDSLGNIAVGDINMQSCTEAYKFCEDVTDGSTYDENDVEYVPGSTNIRHMKFGCNGYIYNSTKLDDILSNICICARGVYTIDNIMRLTMVIDKPNDCSVGLINQSNCLDASNSISFADIPSGYKMNYPNEDDGYQEDVLYAMDDGQDYTNPLKDITDLTLKYVTNTYQAWSLGRYFLGCAKINKESITRTMGAAGYSMMIGDVTDVQDLNILIGTDHGGHIQSLIEDDDYIYGFICDNTFEYTGEVDSGGLCKQGVKILQPTQWQTSRVVSIRMATISGITETDGTKVIPTIGTTNQVVFAAKIVKDTGKLYDDSSSVITYLPESGDIVAFGEVNNITAQYKISKITHTDKNQFQIFMVTYDERLYNYGAKLPSYNSHLNRPASINDVSNLNFTVTQNDIEKAASNAANIANASVNSIVISSSVGVIIRDANASLTPPTVKFNAHIKAYDSTLSDYSGRFIITESINGIDFTQTYESIGDETNHEYTPSTSALLIKAYLYGAGGFTNSYDSETVGIVSNQSGYTAWIENDTLTFSADSTGTISAEQTEISIIKAYKGTVLKSFTVGSIPSIPGITVSNDSGTLTTVAATGTSMADNGTITIPITYNDDSFQINLVMRYTKIKAGATGATGITVTLTANNTVFNYDAAPSPASATVTATLHNHSGTVYYNFYVDGVSKQNTTSNVYTYTPKTLYADMPQNIIVRVRDGSTTGDVIAIDSLDMYGVKNGVDGINGTNGTDGMTFTQQNASQSVPSDSEGTVSSYTGTGNIIRVFEGSTELQAVTGTPTAGQYKVVAAGTDITAGSVSVSGKTAVVAVSSSMTAGTAVLRATVTYTITGVRANGTAFSTTLTQSITKAVAGANLGGNIVVADPTSTTPEIGMEYDETYYNITNGVTYQWSWTSTTTGVWSQVSAEYPTNIAVRYSFDDMPDLPDRASATYINAENWVNGVDGWTNAGLGTSSIVSGYLHFVNDGADTECRIMRYISDDANKLCKIIFRSGFDAPWAIIKSYNGSIYTIFATLTDIKAGQWYSIAGIIGADCTGIISFELDTRDTTHFFDVKDIYVGDGTTAQPIIDNITGSVNATGSGVVSVPGVSGKACQFLGLKAIQLDLSKYANVQNWWTSRWMYVSEITDNTYAWNFGNKDNAIFANGHTLYIRTVKYISGTDYNTQITIPSTLLLNNLVHITVQTTITSSSTTKNVYLNGALYGTNTRTVDNTDLTFGTGFIGGSGLTTGLMSGYQDDWYFGAGEITSAQVLGLYLDRGAHAKLYSLANLQNDQAADDGVISITEKTGVLSLYKTIYGLYTAIIATAATYSVSHTALDTSYNALYAYLYTSPGVLIDFAVATTITAATYQGLWTDFYSKYSDLQTAITNARATAEAGAAQTAAQNFASGLNTQLAAQTDHALMIWDQVSTSDPASAWTTDALKTAHNGDYWYKSDLSTWWRYARTGVNTGSWSQITSSTTVTWLNASKTAANAASVANGKSTVWPSYATAHASAAAGDLFIDSDNDMGYGVSVEYVCLTALAATHRRLTPIVWSTRTTAPSSGMIANDTYFNSSTGILYYYSGSAWVASTSAATQYSITQINSVFARSRSGVITPTKLTVYGKATTAAGTVAYAGRFKIYTADDEGAYTLRYTSTGNESSHEYTILSGAAGVRVELYYAGGTTIPLATQDYNIPYAADVAPGYLGIGILTSTSTQSFAGATVADNGTITPVGTVSHVIAGDSMVNYSGSVTTGIYYWSGTAWVLTTNSKYTSDGTIQDIARLNVGGVVLTAWTSYANLIVKNLFSHKIKITTLNGETGCIYGGDRFDENGNIIDSSKEGFYFNTNGKSCATLSSDDNYNTNIGTGSGFNIIHTEGYTGYYNCNYGYESGYSITTGFDNCNYGSVSGTSITEGYENCNYGKSSGYNITTGHDNNNYGHQSGYHITTGSDNCNYGNGSGFNIISGIDNCNYGTASGYQITTGSYNCSYGGYSGYKITIGGSNNSYGDRSGYSITTGMGNCNYGRWSGYSITTGSDNCNYGNYSGYSITGHDNCNYGTLSGYNITTGNYNACFGYNTFVYNPAWNYQCNINNREMYLEFSGNATGDTVYQAMNYYLQGSSQTIRTAGYGIINNQIINTIYYSNSEIYFSDVNNVRLTVISGSSAPIGAALQIHFMIPATPTNV